MRKIRWGLVFFDTLIYLVSALFILVIYPSSVDHLNAWKVCMFTFTGWLCVGGCRMACKIYRRIWRYAGPQDYIELMVSDGAATLLFLILRAILPGGITFVRTVSLFTLNLLGCMMIRQIYQLIYQRRAKSDALERVALKLLHLVTRVSFADEEENRNRIKIAIIGAGSVGVMLAEELLQNPKANYDPACFVDIASEKVGREVYGIPVLDNGPGLGEKLRARSVQEVVFALPNLSVERRQELYDIYQALGYKIKAYDYPTLGDGRRSIHDFDIEDLLFRSQASFLSEETSAWYEGKSVLITGGGGSTGSELARQIAACHPSRLVILDVYENGAYDIQQELKTRFPDLNIRVEICSVCDRSKLDRIIELHTPDIVLHAAAHKHVPLMERNVCEAVDNNVFGTLNVVEACEKYGVRRFIMVSTDKAVNPVNVMGATKRMCEMIVQSRDGKSTSFSATRFGNVLGSNGSVIPLFKRQIANGGPVTLTDRRIIRYFMTIPEASQLVMTSGAMAKNGELYVLDMGKPVKILELAENMIRLSGLEPGKDIQIIETGLRPGEKLYEELLIKTEELDRTDNDMIFIERDRPLGRDEIEKKLDVLRAALATGSNRQVKEALMAVVPTYHTPEEVNQKALESEEMQIAEG